MKNIVSRIVSLIAVVALVVSVTVTVNATTRSQRSFDEYNLSAKEEGKVRNFAKMFTQRLYETKDIAPLIDQFFVADFLKHASPLDDKASHSSLFAKFSGSEQRRLYIAALNWMYYISLSVLNEEVSNNANSLEVSLENLFMPTIAKKFVLSTKERNLFDVDGHGYTDPERQRQLQRFIPKLEKMVAKAGDYLRHSQPTRTPVLTRESAKWGMDDAYSMKSYWAKDLSADTEAYQVFLPILLDIAVVKIDGQWKVWAMFSDGD